MTKLLAFFKKTKTKITNIFNSRTDTLFFLIMVLIIAIAIPITITAIRQTFYHFNTDDVLQYYPFMSGFIDDIKSGSLSVYDTSVFAGTSIFASLYYIPLDFFTVIAFLLSFVMNNESAYAISNLLRPLVGSIILFYVLTRQGRKNKTAFFASLIFFSCGLSQCYFVFPVYLGILVYAPLGMLIVDLFFDNRKYYYLIPVFAVTVILYDFYLAYMLLAFFMFYALIKSHISNRFSFFGKNAFYKNKTFYMDVFGSLALVLIGVLISAFIMLPSLYYMLNETSRTTSVFDIFTEYKDNKIQLIFYEIKHYFTIFVTLFTPNEPHRLMLIPGGGYIREHVSMFMTVSGLLFFIQFFFLKGKENNRFKGWIILLNVLMIMPIVSMILSANSWPYIRWFFIVYIFNLLGMTKAMDESDLAISKSRSKYVILFVLAIGLATLIYVVMGNVNYIAYRGDSTESYFELFGYKYYYSNNIELDDYVATVPLFLHYTLDDSLFYPILLIGVAFTSIIIAVIIFIRKDKFVKIIMPTLICIECFASLTFIFGYSLVSSNSYYGNAETLATMKDTIVELDDYTDESGYRICVDNTAGKDYSNPQSIEENINPASYFHSFYNSELNTFINDVLVDSGTSGWSKRCNSLYSFIAAPTLNMKYYVVKAGETVDLPTNYRALNDNDVVLSKNQDYWINTFYFTNPNNESDITFSFPTTTSLTESPVIISDGNFNYYNVESLSNTFTYSSETNSISNPTVSNGYAATIYAQVSKTESGSYCVKTYLKIGDSDIEASKIKYELSYDTNKLQRESNYDFNSSFPAQGGIVSASKNGLTYSYYKYDYMLYYSLDDLPEFTVYDKYISTMTGYSAKNLATLNYYAYVKDDSVSEEEIINSGIEKATQDEVDSTLSPYNIYFDSFLAKRVNTLSEYFQVDLTEIDFTTRNMLYAELTTSSIINAQTKNDAFEDMYIVDTNGNVHGMGYNSAYIGDWTPETLMVKYSTLGTDSSLLIKVTAYSTDGYEDYVALQSQYRNRSFALDGNEMSIKFDMDPSATPKIIKTAYTYSDEWIPSDSDYKVVNINGGFLGILVPANTTNVDLTLTFNPTYLKESLYLSLAGVLIFTALIAGVTIYTKKKKKATRP